MADGSLAAAVLEVGETGHSAPVALIEACGFPEIGSLLAHLSVRIDDTMPRPVRLDGSIIAISPAVADDVTTAALALREAIELSVLGAGRLRWADRVLAHATAVAYAVTTLCQRQPLDLRADTSWLTVSGLSLGQLENDPFEAATRIARFLEDRDVSETSCPPDEIEAAARALPLALPTEVLLASGGDDRQAVDWQRGVNSYDISPRPMPWRTTFGSCTASAPTARGFDAAGHVRQRLIEAALVDDLDRAIEAETSSVRSMLLAALGVSDDTVEVVLTPSGTDAELVAAAIAMTPGAPITSIVVGPTEIGSGSVPAASGRHFSRSSPVGEPAVPGEDVTGFEVSPVELVEIPIRHDDGSMIDADEVEALVEQAIESADGRVLLHVLEGSKTGIRLPRAETVARWESRHGDDLDVVIDAAQMRVDQKTVVRHLDAGRMVFVTGSKFFGGPPFSGAVLVPGLLASRLEGIRPLPLGLGSYLTEADVPLAMAPLRSITREGVNFGLLARWQAALAEMRSFHNASPEIRDEVLRVLAAGLRRVLESSPHAEIIESPYTTMPTDDHRGLDDLPTIFAFLVVRSDGTRLDHDEASALHRLLGRDISHLLDSGEDRLATRCFYLGQPVKVVRDGAHWLSALRFAIGAPTISQVVFDYTRGETWSDRIERELSDVSQALDKLAMILRSIDLRAAAAQLEPTPQRAG